MRDEEKQTFRMVDSILSRGVERFVKGGIIQ